MCVTRSTQSGEFTYFVPGRAALSQQRHFSASAWVFAARMDFESMSRWESQLAAQPEDRFERNGKSFPIRHANEGVRGVW